MNPLIQEFTQTWKQTLHLDGQELLRMAILREASRKAHAVRDEELEKLLDSIRDKAESLEADSIEKQLQTQISGTATILSTPPPELAKILPPEKLRRYDRKWETRLAVLALELGWSFWTLEADVQIEKAERFHSSLSQALWPHAVVLFVESLPRESKYPGGWNGCWTLVATADFAPAQLSVLELEGLSDSAHHMAFSWHRLFPSDVL